MRFSDGATGYVLAGVGIGKLQYAMSFSCYDCGMTVEHGTSDASKCAVSARCVLFLDRHTTDTFSHFRPLFACLSYV